MNATLIAAYGTHRVTRAELAQIASPPSTSTWTPVKHSDLVDALHRELDMRGLRVRDEQYAVQRQGKQLFGTLDLDWQDTGEYAAALGLRTGNDKSLSITLVAGLRVFVCSNLCYSGDVIALRRKHTSRLDLPRELADGLDRYQAGVSQLQDGVEKLKQAEISVNRAKVMVYDIFRQQIVPVRLFRPITQTLYTSLRDYGRNEWWVHNAFTTHIKTLQPAPAFRAAVHLGKFFSLS